MRVCVCACVRVRVCWCIYVGSATGPSRVLATDDSRTGDGLGLLERDWRTLEGGDDEMFWGRLLLLGGGVWMRRRVDAEIGREENEPETVKVCRPCGKRRRRKANGKEDAAGCSNEVSE